MTRYLIMRYRWGIPIRIVMTADNELNICKGFERIDKNLNPGITHQIHQFENQRMIDFYKMMIK